MEITDILDPEFVFSDLNASSKKHALQALSAEAAKLTGLTERQIFDVLLEREKLGSTGVGQGIAIPHGRMSELSRIHGIFARLNKPIEFDSVDGEQVDLIFLLLAPESAGADHLKALAKVSRLFRDKKACAQMRQSPGGEHLFDIIAGREHRPTSLASAK